MLQLSVVLSEGQFINATCPFQSEKMIARVDGVHWDFQKNIVHLLPWSRTLTWSYHQPSSDEELFTKLVLSLWASRPRLGPYLLMYIPSWPRLFLEKNKIRQFMSIGRFTYIFRVNKPWPFFFKKNLCKLQFKLTLKPNFEMFKIK